MNFFFEESRDANAKLLQSGKIMLQYDEFELRDLQGKESAYIFSNSSGFWCFVNKELLLFGYSKVDAAMHQYSQEFLEMEKKAKENKAGIWQFQK